MISVEVIYAQCDVVSRCSLKVSCHSTAWDVVQQSGFLMLHEKRSSDPISIGVYGKKIMNPDKYLVQSGDRIELYRPIIRDIKKQKLN